MNKIHIRAFLAGWFDPLEKRLANMARLDGALRRPRKTRRVSINEVAIGRLEPPTWGL
jgi:hypothetical protein